MKKLNELKKNKKGFTLMEMIVVIVIIGILMAILVPGLIKWIDKAKNKQIEANAYSAYQAVQGEILSEYETKSLDKAKEAVIKDQDTLDAVLATAGVEAGSVKYDEIVFNTDEKNPSQIVTFKYYTDNKVATFDGKAWTVTKATP